MPDVTSEDQYFVYGTAEIEWLSSRDRRLGEIIRQTGIIRRKTTPGLFPGLVRAIAGQQISSKAHAAIWKKIISSFDPLTPEAVMDCARNRLEACGLSGRKQEYIFSIAEKIIQGELDGIEKLSDNELLNRLIQLRGVGRWTAEMLLIFTFQRKNILSFDDLAIQRGMRMLYNKKEITRAEFSACHERYSPYSTIAGFYLWHLASNRNQA